MSDPLSSSEIEDVLSSVRRLVSPDARPRPVSRDLIRDRLILTSSLRIVAEQPPTGPAVIKLEPGAKKSRASSAKRAVPVAMRAEDGAEILLPDTPAAAPDLRQGAASPSLSEIALVAEEAVVVIEETVKMPEPEAPAIQPVEKPARRRKAESTAAEVEAKPARKRPLKAAGTASGLSGKAAKSETTPEVPPTVDPVAVAQPEANLVDQAAETVDPPPMKTVPAGADIAEDPAVLLRDLQVPSPAAVGEVQPVPILTDPEGRPISILDEDDLIQLLRRVIREELQGTLGEKITRNVRKLVRAEINRALTELTLD